MRKQIATICVFTQILLLLIGCNKTIALDLSEVTTDPNRFIWGAVEGIDVSLGDMGLFYCENGLLRYFDTDSRQTYILCNKANCLHNSEECNAYFSSGLFGKSAESVAQINGDVYCIQNNVAKNNMESPGEDLSIQLLRVSLAEGTRTIIASFPSIYNVTERDSEAFYAISAGAAEYCNGYAWFTLDMQQPAKSDNSEQHYTQLTGVNLSTGEIIILNGFDEYNYSFTRVCSDTIYYMQRRDLVPLLSISEYYETYGDGIVSMDGNTFGDYEEYWLWHTCENPDEYSIWAYHIATGETEVLYKGTTISLGSGQAGPVTIVGEYMGNALWQEIKLDADENGTYYNRYHVVFYFLTPDDKNKEVVLELRNGGTLNIAQGYHPNLVFPDGVLYYADFTSPDTADIYVYNFNTREATLLFSDDAAITFRIYGEYNGGFFGKHKDHQDNMSFYWISKEDFYAGNLDAAIKYQL